MNKFQRGQMWWFTPATTGAPDEILKLRPCIIVSNNLLNSTSNTLVVVPLSTKIEIEQAVHVPIICNGTESVVYCERIQRVHVCQIKEFIGVCDKGEMVDVDEGIRRALSLY